MILQLCWIVVCKNLYNSMAQLLEALCLNNLSICTLPFDPPWRKSHYVIKYCPLTLVTTHSASGQVDDVGWRQKNLCVPLTTQNVSSVEDPCHWRCILSMVFRTLDQPNVDLKKWEDFFLLLFCIFDIMWNEDKKKV